MSGATILAFPVVPRPTAYLRRPDAAGAAASPRAPAARALPPTPTPTPMTGDARRARVKWLGLRKGRGQWGGVIWLRRPGPALSIPGILYLAALIWAICLTAASLAAMRL